MGNFISVLGKWFPAKEHVNTGHSDPEKAVYKGLDRAAMEYMIENGYADKEGNIISYPGEDYRMNTDLMAKARQLGYKDVDGMLREMFNFDRDSAEAKQKALVEDTVVDHKPAARKKPEAFRSGGDDESRGGKGRKGGFELPDDVPTSKIK